MSAIQPPAQRIWWNQPIHKDEILWVVIAFTWCMIMFFMMPYWHIYGKQNLSNETYKVKPEWFQRATDEIVAKYTVRTETAENIPAVAPLAGSDVYLIARLWSFYPILELEKGKTYRLNLTAMDYQHGFSLQPENINIQIIPGYQHVVNITPTKSGKFSIMCNEYCGIGHHKMISNIYVK